MLNVTRNIQTSERLTRLIIGGLLLIGLLLGLSKPVAFLLGVGLIAEGMIGWCGIPILSEKFKLDSLFKSKAQS
jgi:hypothetical protein